jgi:hypothetical protein
VAQRHIVREAPERRQMATMVSCKFTDHRMSDVRAMQVECWWATLTAVGRCGVERWSPGNLPPNQPPGSWVSVPRPGVATGRSGHSFDIRTACRVARRAGWRVNPHRVAFGIRFIRWGIGAPPAVFVCSRCTPNIQPRSGVIGHERPQIGVFGHPMG